MTRWWALVLAGAVGCGSSVNHERLGDDAVAAGDHVLALAEYRAALQSGNRPRVLAKFGTAALRAGEWNEAVTAFRDLGSADPARSLQAATGLELAALGASREDDMSSLREAVLTLRTVAPERVEGPLALSLALSGTLPPNEAVAILPHALAAAPDAQRVDSLLALYGQAYQEVAACEDAVHIYQALRRRSDVERGEAVNSMATCALRLGNDAIDLNRIEAAERWYRVAVEVDSSTLTGRQALVGFGNARAAQGDTAAASDAMEAAIRQGSPADSLSQVALQELVGLGMGLAGNPEQRQ